MNEYDEDMETFDQYGKMPPLPGMTEEKWNSLTELQKEEYISEYNTIREKDEELKRLRNRVRRGQKRREMEPGDDSTQKQASKKPKKIKRSHQERKEVEYMSDDYNEEDSFIDDESDNDFYEEKTNRRTPRKLTTSTKKRNVPDRIDFEDMKSLCFSRDQLLSYLSNVFFDEIVKNGFILHRETLGDQQMYLIRQVRDVKECRDEYYVGNIPTVKILVVTYGEGEKEVDLNSVSNSKLTDADFTSFIEEREHHYQSIMTKAECKKHLERVKELETKTPTVKDMEAIVARRQLTVNVQKINTVRLRGDLEIKKDQLENELKLMENELQKSRGHVYNELDSRHAQLEKELADVINRIEELEEEEEERIRLLKARDTTIMKIAEKNVQLNHELMRQSSRNHKDNFMSRKPTLPSVSWSTGATQQEIKQEKQLEPEKKERTEKKPDLISAESFHSFKLNLDKPTEEVKQQPVSPKPRKRTGMSLSDYLAMMKE